MSSASKSCTEGNTTPQLTWPVVRFNLFHPEPLQSAKERYNAEVNRLVVVLDTHLKDKSWLVGDKCTYADLVFVMWNLQIAYVSNCGSRQ